MGHRTEMKSMHLLQLHASFVEVVFAIEEHADIVLMMTLAKCYEWRQMIILHNAENEKRRGWNIVSKQSHIRLMWILTQPRYLLSDPRIERA